MDYMKNSLLKRGKQFLNIIKPKTRPGLLSGIFLASIFFVCVFLIGNNVFATSESSIAEFIMQKIGDLFLWLAAKFMSITVFILRFVIEIASYNGYINSTAVGLGWILVRDVANMFFVIILMLIAFGTVLGLEEYAWKKLLVKFVLAAILVNFSRVICGVIIDAAQVFMMTFISGVAATAGGNLVNALALNNVLTFTKSTYMDPKQMVTSNMVASAMLACIFSFGAMVIIGAYLVVLLARVVALWILIILSPLSFVLGVIPKFQTYSGQWWSEFSNNVIIGPVLAFFLWLAFAVAGGGTAHQEFADSPYSMSESNYEQEMQAMAQSGDGGSNLNSFLENETLASFLIAFFMLMAGVKVAKKLGAAGSEIMGQAGGLAMKGAAIMSGAAAVKWGGRKAVAGAAMVKRGAWGATKFGLKKMPVVGLDSLKRKGMKIAAPIAHKYQLFQQKREMATSALAAKGGLIGFAGRLAMTGAQKDDLAKKSWSRVTMKQEERKETMGTGGLAEGRAAGRAKLELERSKKIGEEARIQGLKIPEEEMLREEAIYGKKGLFGMGGREAAAGLEFEADKVRAERLKLINATMIRDAGGINNLTPDKLIEFNENREYIETVAAEEKARTEDVGLEEERAKGALARGESEQSVRFIAALQTSAAATKEKDIITADNRSIEQIQQLRRIEELLRETRMQDVRTRMQGNAIRLDEAKENTDRQEVMLNARSLENIGRDDLAQIETNKFEIGVQKKHEENFAHLNAGEMIAVANRQFARLAQAKEAFEESLSTGINEEEATRRYQRESSLTTALLSASTRDESTQKAVEDAGLARFGYNGGRQAENRAQIIGTLMTGENLANQSTATINDAILEVSGRSQERANAKLKIIQDNYNNLASKTGNAALVAGVQYVDGNYSATTRNDNAIKYIGDKSSLKNATSAAHLVTTDNRGRSVIDSDNIKAVKTMVSSATAANIGSRFLPSFVSEMNDIIGELEQSQAEQFLREIASSMTDQTAFRKFVNSLNKVKNKANLIDDNSINDLYRRSRV